MNTLRVRELLLCSIFATVCLGVAPRSAVSQNTDAPYVLATPGNTPKAYDNPDLVMKYQSTITAEDLAAHL